MLLEKEIQISPAEWQIWKAHPVTSLVLEAMADERSQWVQRLVLGDTLEKSGSEVKETALAVGVVQGLTIILEDLGLYLSEQWAEAQRRKEEKEMEEEDEF